VPDADQFGLVIPHELGDGRDEFVALAADARAVLAGFHAFNIHRGLIGVNSPRGEICPPTLGGRLTVKGPRILILDIETAPHLAYVWGLWDQRVGLNQIVEVSSVLCFAAKWHGRPKVHFASDHHDGHDQMVAKAHALVDEADAVVHYNGRAFDMKHLRREFLLAGLGPPSPHKDIDLLTVARSKFKFASNKLAHISVALGLEGKAETGGFELWTGCMAGDAAAWRTMKSYNVQDVLQTEQVYDRLLPWIDGHPHNGLYGRHGFEAEDICGRCGGTALVRRGYTYTQVGRYRKYQCGACRSYSRGRKRVGTVDARPTS
jgi:hypothetical protein